MHHRQRPELETKRLSSFQAINASVDTVLMQYEQLTGKVLIKDSNLSANALPITISVPQPVPKSELVRLIEASLLLNNIVLVPAQEPNTVKVININTGKNPRSEGVRSVYRCRVDPRQGSKSSAITCRSSTSRPAKR